MAQPECILSTRLVIVVTSRDGRRAALVWPLSVIMAPNSVQWSHQSTMQYEHRVAGSYEKIKLEYFCTN